MKIQIQISLSILATIILITCIDAQQNDKSISNSRKEILSWLNEYKVPAVGIGIIKDGKLTECKVFGESRKGIPANDSTIFSIASVTKTIVAMITLKLVETKQWDLDEPLANYWTDPDIANDPRLKELTTRHVLSHQSGFPNWRNDTESKKLQFNFEPGSKYQYSGEGFEYLKNALEHKFNKSLECLSDSILFRPLNMKDTRYHWDNKVDESRFAFRYDSEGKEYQERIQTNASAAYGLLTTVKDYSKFGIDVINRAGLSDHLFNEMISTQVNIKKNIDQGLGWQIFRNLANGEYALLHEGGANGVSTLAVLLPVSKRGIVIFTNGDNGDKIYTKVLEKFLDIGKDIIKNMNQMSYDPEQIKIIEVPKDILSNYPGSYFVPSFQMSIKIKYENDLLKLESPYSTMILYPESETKFFLKDDDLKIEFVKDEFKKTIGLWMTYKGAKPEYAKRTE